MKRWHWSVLPLAALFAVPALAATPLAGFPKKVPGSQPGKDPLLVTSALAVDPVEPSRVYFASGAELHCLGVTGSVCEGFPARLGEKVTVVGAPALGDVDGDGRSEIVLALSDGKVAVVRADGTLLPFTFQEPTGLEAGASTADVDGDGKDEVLLGSKGGRLHVLRADGSEAPGFPVVLPAAVTSSVSSGRFGAPSKVALACGSENGKVYLTDAAGKAVPGFPVSSGYLVSGQPAVGDVDFDGQNDVAFASQDFKVYLFHPDGKPYPGFPANVGARLLSGPALGDLDGDGKLEIAVTAFDGKVHAFTVAGQELKGFPVKLADKLVGSAVIADLDRDGKEELLATGSDGQVHVLRGNGKPFPGFPAKTGMEAIAGPVVVESGDGTIIFQGSGDKVMAFKVKRAGKATAALAWREQGHDASRSGRVHPNPPSYAELKVSPPTPSTDDALTAEYRFFDLDGDPEPATEIRWFKDGKEVPELLGKKVVPKEATRKKEKWRFQVVALGGTPRQSTETVVVNSKPGRPQIAFEPPVLRRAEAIRVKVTEDAPDADGDKVSYRYVWLKDGQPQKGFDKPEVPSGVSKKGERWSVVVAASDGEAEGATATLEATVADSAPTAPEIAVQPAAPKAADAVKLVIAKPSTDVDGDSLKYRYRYFVDGVPLSLATSLDALPPLSGRKKQVISVEVQADDGELLGPAAKAQVTVVNTAPTAPTPSVVPREPRKADTLVAGLAAAATDIDGDVLTYRFAFARDGKKVADGRELAGLKKGEVYEITAIASDGEADSVAGKVSVTVKNTPPTAPKLAFEGLPLRRADALTVKIAEPSVDADGDAIAYRYVWSKQGQPQAGLTAALLPAGTVKKGERWRVTVTPFDGEAEGTPAFLETQAADSAPGPLEIALMPADPKVGDVVKAVVKREAADVDGDKLKYRYLFSVDGTPVALDPTVDTLPAQTARKKQVVSVEVRADDGELTGPVASAKATVANTAPDGCKVQLPAEIRTAEALQGSLATPATDVDGDKLVYRFSFTRGGKAVEAAGDGREVRGVKKGEVYEFEAVANDGEVDSKPCKASLTVKNTLPTAPGVTFESLPLRRAEFAKVKIARASMDADGDAIVYRYAWSRNGQVQAGLSNGEVPAGTFKKGERWKVTVTPFDGEAEGASSSVEATVADSAPGALEISLAPAEPKIGDAIKAVIVREAADVDGDKLKYRYVFALDGVPVVLDSTVDTLPARSARKKQVVSVEVRADDGELTGPVATAKTTVVNTPPEAPKVGVLPAELRHGDVVVGALTAPASDADGDKLTYRFAFTRDGKKAETLAEGREVRGVKKGEVYEFEAIANDGEADSPAARVKVTVRNTRPTSPAVSFANAAPLNGEAVDVKVERAAVDVDGDAIAYSYAWTVNGKVATLTPDAKGIPAGRLKKHEVWTVEVTPSDGQESGPAGKSRLEVINTLPTAPSIAIDPAEPTAESGVKAKITQPATDRDGDAIVYRYAWFKDGIRLELPVEATSVAPGTIKRGEELRVVVTPFDGEGEGASAAATARVRNTAPTAPQIIVQPEKPTVRDALSCVVKVPAKDADKETPVLRFVWKRNGEAVPNSTDQDKLMAGGRAPRRDVDVRGRCHRWRALQRRRPGPGGDPELASGRPQVGRRARDAEGRSGPALPSGPSRR